MDKTNNIVDNIVYSKQEVIVEKIEFPEEIKLGDARGICLKKNGDVVLLDLRSPKYLVILSHMQLKKEAIVGTHHAATFYPIGIWADEDDSIIIANTYANEVIILGKETDTVLLGDDTVQGPRGIFKDKQGNLFVCDAKNNRILKYSHDGQISHVNKGTQPSPFNLPTGLCVLDSGEVIVADCENNCIQKVDLEGNTTVLAGVPSKDGGYSDVAPVTMNWPYNVKELGSHLVFVEAMNNSVRVILKDGRVFSLRTNFDSAVMYLRGLAVDKNQNIYVTAVGNNLYRIRPKPNIDLALQIFTLWINDNLFSWLPKELIYVIVDFAALNWHLS
jgi:hypothetical protein